MPDSLLPDFNQYIHSPEWGIGEVKQTFALQAYEANGVRVAAEILLSIVEGQLMKGLTYLLLSYNRNSLDEHHKAQTGSER